MEHHNTLGRRIQSYRKASGLSQEALGEQLQVSRQAVSKWESDSTIPELDSLIAMSSIFHVSVGQLLGVEPADSPQKTGDEQAAPSGELTEKEWAAVEAIAVRYVQETTQHNKPRQSPKQRRLAIAAAAVLCLGALWWGHHQLGSIEQQFTTLTRRVDNIDRNVSYQIQLLAGQMETILAEGTSILSNSSATVTDFDLDAETITLKLSASPKEWTESSTAVFTVLSTEETFLSDAVLQQGGVFQTELTVPMDPHIQLSVTFTDHGAARTEQMESLDGYGRSSFRLQATGTWSASLSYRTVELGYLSLHIDSPLSSDSAIVIEPVTGDLCLFRNQETEPEQIIPIRMLRNTYNVQGLPLSLYSIENEYYATYDLNPSDVMLEVLRLEDSTGRTTYTILGGHSYREGHGIITLDLPEGYHWKPGDKLRK